MRHLKIMIIRDETADDLSPIVLALDHIEVTVTLDLDKALELIERDGTDVLMVPAIGMTLAPLATADVQTRLSSLVEQGALTGRPKIIAIANERLGERGLRHFARRRIAHLCKPFFPSELLAVLEYLHDA